MSDFEPAVRRLQELSTGAGPEERRACFDAVRPILSDRQTPEFVRHVEKLVQSGSVERAIRLLESAPARRFPRLRQALSGMWLPPTSAAVAIILIALGVRDVTNSKASPLWPTAGGEVLESRLISVESFRTNTPRTVKAYVRYRYTVNGQDFEGERISYKMSSVLSSTRVKRYPVGRRVVVYYKPDEPRVSVLEPGFGLLVYAWFAASGLFLLFALFGLREMREAARSGSLPVP